MAVAILPSGKRYSAVISVPDIDQRAPPSVRGCGTAVSALPSVRAIYVPVKVCVASMKRAKSSRP
jgi:hypothetical protein